MKVFQNNKWHNIDPADLVKLVEETISELGGEEAVNDLIRREKACKIEDIFRGAKLAQCYDHRFVPELRDPSAFFDKLYKLDLDALDAYSEALDKRNTEYMKLQVFKHNNGKLNS